MIKIKKLFHVFALTLIVMTLTLFTPTTVHTVEQERDIHFGFPTTFVSMNSSYDLVEREESSVEYYLTNLRQHPARVIWKEFGVSFLIWFTPIGLLFLLLNKFLKNYRTFEIFLTSFLFLFVMFAFIRMPLEIFIIFLLMASVVQLLNEYISTNKKPPSS